MLLYQVLAFSIHEKKNSYKNNKFKMSTPTWNEKYELPRGSHSVSDARCFEYIIKKYETMTDNPPIRICVNKRKR